MAHRKGTLRRMSPTVRKLARLNGELQSVYRRVSNLLPVIAQLEHDSRALAATLAKPAPEQEPEANLFEGE